MYFGTDGVRGVVGEGLTEDVVRRLGLRLRALDGRRSVLIGRDTRALRPGDRGRAGRGARGRRFARSARRRAAHARRRAARGGMRRGRLGLAQPARVQRREALRARRPQAHRRGGARDRGALRRSRDGRRAAGRARRFARRALRRPRGRALRRPARRPADRVRLGQRCVQRDRAGRARAARRDGDSIGDAPDGTNINSGCGATHPDVLAELVRNGDFDLGVAFDGDGDRVARRRRGRERHGRRRHPRRAGAPPGRRPRRGHDDDEPRLPQADGRATGSARSRPTWATATCSRRSTARAASSAASSRATSPGSTGTRPGTDWSRRYSSRGPWSSPDAPSPSWARRSSGSPRRGVTYPSKPRN